MRLFFTRFADPTSKERRGYPGTWNRLRFAVSDAILAIASASKAPVAWWVDEKGVVSGPRSTLLSYPVEVVRERKVWMRSAFGGEGFERRVVDVRLLGPLGNRHVGLVYETTPDSVTDAPRQGIRLAPGVRAWLRR